jgi:hypothetical protein
VQEQKNHIIISIHTVKTSGKIQYPFIIKAPKEKLRIEELYINIMKSRWAEQVLSGELVQLERGEGGEKV